MINILFFVIKYMLYIVFNKIVRMSSNVILDKVIFTDRFFVLNLIVL